jgi:hypothetical protein
MRRRVRALAVMVRILALLAAGDGLVKRRGRVVAIAFTATDGVAISGAGAHRGPVASPGSAVPPPASPPVSRAPEPVRVTSGDVLRTGFSDQAAWEAVRDAITAETTEGFRANVRVVDDPGYAGAAVDDVIAEAGEHVLGFVVLVDDVALTTPDHPVLVVSLSPRHRGERFRSIPSGIQSIENNLSLANMDWEDFAGSVDAHGVFRGF